MHICRNRIGHVVIESGDSKLMSMRLNQWLYVELNYWRYADSHCKKVYYTFSHCEPAPSQLNAAWGNSFRQLHSNFDNLLELRHIALEYDPVCSYSTDANGFRQGHSISAWIFNSLNSVTSVNEVHCVDFQCPLPYRGALCRYEATFVGVVSQLTTPMQSADLSWTDADSQWEKV